MKKYTTDKKYKDRVGYQSNEVIQLYKKLRQSLDDLGPLLLVPVADNLEVTNDDVWEAQEILNEFEDFFRDIHKAIRLWIKY